MKTNPRYLRAAALVLLFIAGCATVPVPTVSRHAGSGGQLGECADFFVSLDQRISQAGAVDAGAFRVKGYPYLRVNRFLASFGDAVEDPAAFDAWVGHMQTLDRVARVHEISNLARSASSSGSGESAEMNVFDKIAYCGDLLKAVDFEEHQTRASFAERVRAPDEYLILRRVFGLYPITGLFVSNGVSRWHGQARQSFSNDPPKDWQTLRYFPEDGLTKTSDGRSTAPITRDPLGIPVYSDEALAALFIRHAPVWEIQVKGEDDRIGTPFWAHGGELGVDTGSPVTYTLISFTRFGKMVFPQLNYIIWFPARPKVSPWDLYGGRLDGVNFRVTLDENGDPLLYETIHNCGCYYEAYPTPRLRVRKDMPYAEAPLILTAPRMSPEKPIMTLAMASGTHYATHFYSAVRGSDPEPLLYSLADYNRLRSLPAADGRRSLFDQDSIVKGSERLERIILWPTGVLSPGAMRQWGRHAVAFVGKRHFDDPFYMEKMFDLE